RSDHLRFVVLARGRRGAAEPHLHAVPSRAHLDRTERRGGHAPQPVGHFVEQVLFDLCHESTFKPRVAKCRWVICRTIRARPGGIRSHDVGVARYTYFGRSRLYRIFHSPKEGATLMMLVGGIRSVGWRRYWLALIAIVPLAFVLSTSAGSAPATN